MAGTGTKGQPLVPVQDTNRDQWWWARSEAHWSWFVPPTGTKGARRTGTNGPTRPGRPPGLTNRDQCPHGSRFVTELGLMGLSSLNESHVFYKCCVVSRKDLPGLGVVALPSLLYQSRCVDLSRPHVVPYDRWSDLLLQASQRAC